MRFDVIFQTYGLQPIYDQKPRRVTVFLNPAAHKGLNDIQLLYSIRLLILK